MFRFAGRGAEMSSYRRGEERPNIADVAFSFAKVTKNDLSLSSTVHSIRHSSFYITH